MRVKVTISASALWRAVARWFAGRRAAQAERDRARTAQLVAEMEAIRTAKIVSGLIQSDGSADSLSELHRLRHPEAFR